MSTHAIETSHAAPPVGPYPHARRVGDWLLLSGVGPRRPGTAPHNPDSPPDIPGVTLNPDGSLASHDITAQTHAVMANVKAILEAAGASWNDLVDVTVYLTNMQSDFKTVNALWLEYFPEPEFRPCRTTVEINALPTPIAIELKCMAYLGSSGYVKGENA